MVSRVAGLWLSMFAEVEPKKASKLSKIITLIIKRENFGPFTEFCRIMNRR